MRSDAAAFGWSIHAVLVGVNRAHASLGLSELLSPEAHVEALAATLAREDGCAIRREQIITLTGPNATLENVLSTFSEIVAHLPYESSLFVYFASHGLADDEELYLCLYDTVSHTSSNTALTSARLDRSLDNDKLRGVCAPFSLIRRATLTPT